MNAETTRYLNLLEQRIVLLGELGKALQAARSDIVGLDITGLEGRILKQEELCTEIQSLDAQLNRMQGRCEVQISSCETALSPPQVPNTSRVRETMERLQKVQAQVKQLNEAHKILLRRSRRTVGALLNSYHSFALTYSDPSARSRTASREVA